MLEETLQSEIEKLKKKVGKLFIGIGALSLSTIIAIILWLLGLNINAKPFYELEIDTTKFNLRDSVDSFRSIMKPHTKTHLVGYNESSITSYHALKFQSIITSSGITIPVTSPNYSWQTVFYSMIKDGKMALVIMPGIVEKDTSGKIIKVFDYFDSTTFATIYQRKQIAAYDFGHLEP